jgi:hypothetical protein
VQLALHESYEPRAMLSIQSLDLARHGLEVPHTKRSETKEAARNRPYRTRCPYTADRRRLESPPGSSAQSAIPAVTALDYGEVTQ